jgi:hypothetical protein
MRGSAVTAGIAAVLDQDDIGIGTSEDMILPALDRRIEFGRSCPHHDGEFYERSENVSFSGRHEDARMQV